MRRAIAVALAITMVLMAISVIGQQAAAASSYDFVKTWGSLGSGQGQFDSPAGVAIDASGNVYVADWNNGRIQKFTTGGEFITAWGSYDGTDARLAYPSGVAVDSSGNVIVTDPYEGGLKVQKFDASGNHLATLPIASSIYSTGGIAIDPAGNMYIMDVGQHKVIKGDATGNFVTSWGSLGTGDGQFWFGEWGIAVDQSGNVYVADGGNNRVQKFSSAGVFQTKWGSAGTGDGQFNAPSGVAVDSSGNVLVTDTGNDRVQVFDSSGNFLASFGSSGTGDGQLDGPRGIAVGPSGNVYVVDAGNNRIAVFSPATPDTTAPTFSAFNKQKVSGSLVIAISDDGSGVDWGTLTVLVDRRDVTSSVVITADGIEIPSSLLAAKKSHSISIKVSDVAGNVATVRGNIRMV